MQTVENLPHTKSQYNYYTNLTYYALKNKYQGEIAVALCGPIYSLRISKTQDHTLTNNPLPENCQLLTRLKLIFASENGDEKMNKFLEFRKIFDTNCFSSMNSIEIVNQEAENTKPNQVEFAWMDMSTPKLLVSLRFKSASISFVDFRSITSHHRVLCLIIETILKTNGMEQLIDRYSCNILIFRPNSTTYQDLIKSKHWTQKKNYFFKEDVTMLKKQQQSACLFAYESTVSRIDYSKYSDQLSPNFLLCKFEVFFGDTYVTSRFSQLRCLASASTQYLSVRRLGMKYIEPLLISVDFEIYDNFSILKNNKLRNLNLFQPAFFSNLFNDEILDFFHAGINETGFSFIWVPKHSTITVAFVVDPDSEIFEFLKTSQLPFYGSESVKPQSFDVKIIVNIHAYKHMTHLQKFTNKITFCEQTYFYERLWTDQSRNLIWSKGSFFLNPEKPDMSFMVLINDQFYEIDQAIEHLQKFHLVLGRHDNRIKCHMRTTSGKPIVYIIPDFECHPELLEDLPNLVKETEKQKNLEKNGPSTDFESSPSTMDKGFEEMDE